MLGAKQTNNSLFQFLLCLGDATYFPIFPIASKISKMLIAQMPCLHPTSNINFRWLGFSKYLIWSSLIKATLHIQGTRQHSLCMNSSFSHLEAILRLDLQIPQQKTWRQRNICGYKKGLEHSQIFNINEKSTFGQLLWRQGLAMERRCDFASKSR